MMHDRPPRGQGIEPVLLAHLVISILLASLIVETVLARHAGAVLAIVGVTGTLIGWLCLAAKPD